MTSGAQGGPSSTWRKLERPFATVTGGEHRLARVAAGGSTRLGSGELLVGSEAKAYDGPWELPQELRKLSGLGRYSWERGRSQLSVLAMAYHNDWDASDQIPLRAARAGALDRFGQVDSSDGGHTERYSLSGSWRRLGGTSAQKVQAFAIYSDLSLFSNFGYFLGDSIQGDQFNQRERRVILGAFYRPSAELALDLDISLWRARFVDAGEVRIPGALERVVAAGLSWSPVRSGPLASIRLRHFGEYPLTEDNRVRADPTTLVNAEVGYQFPGLRLQASVLNLFDVRHRDIQYYYTSRLPGEPAAGVDGIHFHPVEPRQVRIMVSRGL